MGAGRLKITSTSQERFKITWEKLKYACLELIGDLMPHPPRSTNCCCRCCCCLSMRKRSFPALTPSCCCCLPLNFPKPQPATPNGEPNRCPIHCWFIYTKTFCERIFSKSRNLVNEGVLHRNSAPLSDKFKVSIIRITREFHWSELHPENGVTLGDKLSAHLVG